VTILGRKFCKKLGDFVKPLVYGIETGPQGSAVRHGTSANLLRLAFEHPVKVFPVPSESDGQGFECAATTAALHGMPLDFAHDGYRDMRTPRKLALTPAKLADTVADSPRDRSPVLGIAFQRVPPRSTSSAESSRSPRESARAETSRSQAESSRNTQSAEIISESMISVILNDGSGALAP
jgi:hypothetical protein